MVVSGKKKLVDDVPVKLYVPDKLVNSPVDNRPVKRWIENGVPTRRRNRSPSSSYVSSLASSPWQSPGPSPGPSRGPSPPTTARQNDGGLSRIPSLQRDDLGVSSRGLDSRRDTIVKEMEEEKEHNAINVIPVKKSALEDAVDDMIARTTKMRANMKEFLTGLDAVKSNAERVSKLCKRWTQFANATGLRMTFIRWRRRTQNAMRRRLEDEGRKENVGERFTDIYASKRLSLVLPAKAPTRTHSNNLKTTERKLPFPRRVPSGGKDPALADSNGTTAFEILVSEVNTDM